MNESSLARTVRFNDLDLTIQADSQLEWVMSSADVAAGYGVKPAVIRMHKKNHADELIESKHWVVNNVDTLGGGRQESTMWTRKGVIRLGMFIKSSQARAFRDLVEDLVLEKIEAPALPTLSPLELLVQMAQNLVDIEKRTTQSLLIANLASTKITALELRLDESPITSEKKGRIYKLGQELARVMGGDYKTAWGTFKKKYGLAAYADLPNHKFEDAVKFLCKQIESYGGPNLLEGGETV